MADPFDNVETDDDGNEYVRIPKQDAINQRNLARQAEANAEAVARAEAAERRLAFRDAGIPSGVLGDMFMETYKGDLDVDKIKEAAAKVPGLLEAEPAAGETQPQLTAEEIEAQRLEAEQTPARQELARNGGPDVPPGAPTGWDAADEVFTKEREQGRRLVVAQGMGVAALAQQAARGDKSVLVQNRVASGE